MPSFLTNISPVEIGVIVLILILFFGSRVVTGIARTSGETLKEIKKIKNAFTDSFEDDGKKEKGVSK
jgi:Sec-independent protein translocase protein TatA